jgi:hypothetical protein
MVAAANDARQAHVHQAFDRAEELAVVEGLFEDGARSRYARIASETVARPDAMTMEVYDKTGIDSVVGLVHWLSGRG